jgi:very-short-patch-repair endonuclease
LPSRAQTFIESCRTSPDFIYDEFNAAIYVDGPPHKFADRQKRDEVQTNSMEDNGYTVIRFKQDEDWEEVVKKYPNIFGRI